MKNKKITGFVLFFSAILLVVNVTYAQVNPTPASISGKITDEENLPVGSATVTLFHTKDSSLVKGEITTDEGNYELNSLQPGEYYIVANFLGFQESSSEVIKLSAGEKKTISSIQLIEDINMLEEVLITSEKPLIEHQVDKVVMNIENSALATGNTALELLQRAPGVSIEQDQISLRGRGNVSIIIDGKQTYLSQGQLLNLLTTTQPNSIQSIEIITNPSSKYDAAGSSGIINIIMKKNRLFGTSGTVGLEGGYGRYYKAGTNVSLNHKQKFFNLFTNYAYGERLDFNDLQIDRSINSQAGTTFFNSTSYAKFLVRSHNFKGGMDFYLNDRNTIGFIFSGNISRESSNRTGTTRIGQSANILDSAIISLNDGYSADNYLTYNLNHKTILDTSGTEITTSFDYSNYNGNDYQNFTNRYTDRDLVDYRTPLRFINRAPTTVHIYVGKGDIVHPWNKTAKLEAGIKYSYVQTDNNLIFDIHQSDGAYENDPARSNRFKYTERISAAYVSFSKEFNNLSLQFGLRTEQTHSEGNSITELNRVKRKYLDLFPTLFLKHKISPNNTLGASYSRRIDRPDYGSLNPFTYFVDQYTYNQGNPYLNPQYSDSYEINYVYKNSYFASLNYSHTRDVISNVILSDPETKAIFKTKENLSTSNYYSLNLSAPITIAKWWDSYTNLTIFHSQYKSPDINGDLLNLARMSWQFNTSQIFTLGNTTSAEINANYFAPRVNGIFTRRSFYGIDFGIKKSLVNEKLEIKLSLSDIFNTRGRQIIFSDLPNNKFNIQTGFESRIVRLSLSYRFGNTNIKATDKRGGAEAEESRLK